MEVRQLQMEIGKLKVSINANLYNTMLLVYFSTLVTGILGTPRGTEGVMQISYLREYGKLQPFLT